MSFIYDAYHAARRKSRTYKVVAGAVVTVLVGSVVIATPGGGGGGSTANLWVDTTAGTGTCTRAATAAGYTDAASCSSFNAAVAAASNGDTIRVKAGTYAGQTCTADRTAQTYLIADSGVSVGGTLVPGCNWVEFRGFSVTGGMDLEDVDAQHVTLTNVSAAGHVTIDGPDFFTWTGGTLGAYVIDHGDWPGRVMIQGSPGATTNIVLDGLTIQPVTRTASSISNGDHTEIIRFNQGVTGATLQNLTFVSGSNINSSTIFIGGAGAATNETNLTFQNIFFGQNTDGQPIIDTNGQGAACNTYVIAYNTNISSNNLWTGGSANCTSQANVTVRGNLGKSSTSCGSSVYDNNVWSNFAGCGGGDLGNQTLSFTGDGFHITTSSPAVGNGSATCPATDHDLQGRPQPAATTCDAGADEVSQ